MTVRGYTVGQGYVGFRQPTTKKDRIKFRNLGQNRKKRKAFWDAFAKSHPPTSNDSKTSTGN